MQDGRASACKPMQAPTCSSTGRIGGMLLALAAVMEGAWERVWGGVDVLGA